MSTASIATLAPKRRRVSNVLHRRRRASSICPQARWPRRPRPQPALQAADHPELPGSVGFARHSPSSKGAPERASWWPQARDRPARTDNAAAPWLPPVRRGRVFCQPQDRVMEIFADVGDARSSNSLNAAERVTELNPLDYLGQAVLPSSFRHFFWADMGNPDARYRVLTL